MDLLENSRCAGHCRCNVPQARDFEVLSLLTTLITKLDTHMVSVYTLLPITVVERYSQTLLCFFLPFRNFLVFLNLFLIVRWI